MEVEALWTGSWWDGIIVKKVRGKTAGEVRYLVTFKSFPSSYDLQLPTEFLRPRSTLLKSNCDHASKYLLQPGDKCVALAVHPQFALQQSGVQDKAWYDGTLMEVRKAKMKTGRRRRCQCIFVVALWKLSWKRVSGLDALVPVQNMRETDWVEVDIKSICVAPVTTALLRQQLDQLPCP